MASWLARLAAGIPGSEREVVDRYTNRLLAVAAQRLPARMRQRVDPEDIVQSVYRSFFRRVGDNRLRLDESQDLWRLLVAITYYKIVNTVKFHQRKRRDVRRDVPATESALPQGADGPDVGAADLEVLYESLERLLRVLPEKSKDIVILRLEGDTIDEIAAKVGRSRRTVIRVLANVQDLAAHLLEESI